VASPTATVTSPPAPPEATPVTSDKEPLGPAAASPDFMMTFPEESLAALPMETEPLEAEPAPLLSARPPPTPLPLAPAVMATEPPAEDESPAATVTSPLPPPELEPDPIMMEPEGPVPAAPVANLTAPLVAFDWAD